MRPFTPEELEDMRRWDAAIEDEERQKQRELDRRYREKKKERINAQRRELRKSTTEEQREAARARQRAFYQKNRERLIAKAKARQEANKEAYLEYQKNKQREYRERKKAQSDGGADMAISKKKKPKKPNKQVTVRQSDIKRLEREWTSNATELASTAFLTILHDKEGYGAKRLARLWSNVEKLMQEVYEGRVDIFDLKKVLEDELGITFGKE